MRDACDHCYRTDTLLGIVCEKCPEKARKKYLADQMHQAEQIVYWLSYQSEMSNEERTKLKQMSDFLQDLREQI